MILATYSPRKKAKACQIQGKHLLNYQELENKCNILQT